MAGIGFELRKVVGQKGLTGFIKASLSGTIIVAGPWLISIAGITIIQTMTVESFQELPGAFMASVIYCYAFSLILGGGFHYIFTRVISDLLYEKDEAGAFYYLLKFLIPTTIISTLIGLPAVLTFSMTISHPFLFSMGTLLLFISINILWVVMLFISVLKWYMQIMISFSLGMGASVLLLIILGNLYGTGGAIMGFALGHLIICAILIFISFLSYRPKKREGMKGRYLRYFIKYKFLFLTGAFYYLGIWVDKVINWFVAGTAIAGTFLSIYEPYDVTVYFANLSMIPGLVFFVVSSETKFYILFKKFLISLGRTRFSEIQRHKYRLISSTMKSIREQSIFQGLITLLFVLIAPSISSFISHGKTEPVVIITTLCAIFFQLLYLTFLNFLFYLEMYRRAFYAAFTYFIVNLSVSYIAALISVEKLSGIGYLAGGIAGTVVAFIAYSHSIRKIDRYILAGIRY
ncbi:MAG: exopolysaccharide Pel transporter PelG [Spirochaetales bacterium]|nr:exopolysaccharide Pel transporter PelG [Spirochaetales bacterium]